MSEGHITLAEVGVGVQEGPDLWDRERRGHQGEHAPHPDSHQELQGYLQVREAAKRFLFFFMAVPLRPRA